jgi:hypothetical protein
MKPRFDILMLSKSACAHLNPHLFAQEKPKKAKYGNKKVEVDGEMFDSQKEAKRWGELKLLLKAGEIGMLRRQVVYELKVKDKRLCKYVADFVYLDSKTGETVVEDVKSSYTRKLPVYRLKKKLMKELLNIEIKEV